MQPDLRRVLDALAATALGTFIGILADSGFTVRASVIHPLFWVLDPVFDLFSAFPNAQLVGAGVVDRLPVVLILGLATGMVLRFIRLRRLLLWTLPLWPACATIHRLAAPTGTNSFVPELALYVLQYALLILVVRGTHALLIRPAIASGGPAGNQA